MEAKEDKVLHLRISENLHSFIALKILSFAVKVVILLELVWLVLISI